MPPSPTIPPGSWILVTGVNGFICGHTAKQLLDRGYKVRGTVRGASKSAWLTNDLFAVEAASSSFEIVEVRDLAAPDAFSTAMRNVSGVVHVATITSMDPNSAHVVPQAVSGCILNAAASGPSVKQVVYTSTAGVAAMLVPNTTYHVIQTSWNDLAAREANAPPRYHPDRSMAVYLASKVEAERILWKFVEEEKPHFTVNAVLPFTTFGDRLHHKQNFSADGMIFGLYHGDTSFVGFMKALTYVHVRDVALMHVAALLDPGIANTRIHAWSQHFTWNGILAILRRLRPHEKLIDDLEVEETMLATVNDSISRRLLKDWSGRDEWLDLETGIRDTIDGKWPAK